MSAIESDPVAVWCAVGFAVVIVIAIRCGLGGNDVIADQAKLVRLRRQFCKRKNRRLSREAGGAMAAIRRWLGG